MEAKRGYITIAQKELMVEFMEDNPELQGAKLEGKFTHKLAQSLWIELAKKLNAIPGARKEWKQWRKTWQDLKKNSKAKQAKIKKHENETGGGPTTSELLDNIENKVIGLMSKSQIEGHNNVEESEVTFEFNNEDIELNVVNISTTDFESNYTENDILQNSREDPGKVVVIDHDYKKPTKKLTKVKRLENSLSISKHLVGLTEDRTLTQRQYQEKKLSLIKEEITQNGKYQEFKKKILEETLNTQKEILQELKDLKFLYSVNK